MVSRNTILVPSLGLRIGQACEAGLSAGMRRERVSPQIRKKERKRQKQQETLCVLQVVCSKHLFVVHTLGRLRRV